MHLTCRQCGAEIDADDVNLDRMIAKCARCNAVFSFADSVGGGSARARSLDVPLPAGFGLEHTGSGLRITRRWFSPKVLFLAFFAVFWNGFVIFWMSMVIGSGVWPMALFGSLHAAVGLGLAYYVLAGLLNTTTVEADGMVLRITHRPLPYPGKRLEAGSINQLYCKAKVHHGRNSTTVTYELHAVTNAGKHEKLLAGLDESEQALFLEQELERFLRLKDQPVRGELVR